jgi:hypothetical protein
VPKARQVATQDEFTGGLNLRANQFQLANNESPEMLNVDIDPRGGVHLRRGVAPWAEDLSDPVHSLGQFRSASTSQVLAGHGTEVSYTTGTTWATVKNDNTVSTPLTFAQFKDAIYIQNGTDQPIKWTGTTATRLAQTYAEDFDSPGSGKMPVGRLIAAHNGHVFVANTLESATRYPNRIRWSHPNQPESYRALDYIDVDPGVDGDEIVALVPFTDHLLVMKRRSTHVLYGFGWESFSVQKVSADIGCANSQAAVSTPGGVYLWSPDTGVWRYGGRGVEWTFASLWPAIETGSVDANRQDEVRLGWLDNRLWVSVPWAVGTLETAVFVLDPTISKSGSWTAYHLPIGVMLSFGVDDQPSIPLAAYNDGDRLLQLELENQSWDDFDGETQTHIESYYRTPWFDMNQPAVIKRFHAPTFVFQGNSNDVATIEVYTDYDSLSVSKSFTESVSSTSGEAVWDTLEWDTDLWGGQERLHAVQRGAPLGKARAVQLKVTGPATNITWGMDAVSLVYTPRKVR